MDSMFEKAARIKLRFETKVGMLSVEDIFDLPLTVRNDNALSLDEVAKNLNRAVKDTAEESFVVEQSKVNEELQLGFDIVLHVIAFKKAAVEEAKNVAAKKERRQTLLAALTKKRENGVNEMTAEQIEAELAAL